MAMARWGWQTSWRSSAPSLLICLPAIVLPALLPASRADSAEAAAWQTVDAPHDFRFPRDHAAHPEYRIEWWYYTGNLRSAEGRRFGYQLTFFRIGVDPAPENPSRWAVRDLYMAHFALTDIDAERFHAFERLNRRGIGQAGAEADRYRVWNGDWEARLTDETAAGRNHRLVASQGEIAIQLSLMAEKRPVLQGDRGLSRKGPSSGNASHYYSLTRLGTQGTITVDGQTLAVSGSSWMDHEFSSSFLEPGQEGWDWFALQLDDGRELMLYQIRRHDGGQDPFSSGTIVDVDGNALPLAAGQFQLQPARRWKSPQSAAAYPVEWTVRVPSAAIDLRVRAALPQQELHLARASGVVYWEGAVTAQGTSRGRPIAATGYLEMTGYAGKDLVRALR